ncbi:hypothetical protein HanPSC8_Chr09g0394131 [Helianthus annuus]|nr:hypothetical protein HanPSC8_Chr09g0394131 [Helianthus annuus]
MVNNPPKPLSKTRLFKRSRTSYSRLYTYKAQDLCARSSGILNTVPQARIGKISQNVFT